MISFNSKFTTTIFGLQNNGSICWFNALIQSLLSLSSFNQRLIELFIKTDKNDENHFGIALAKFVYKFSNFNSANDNVDRSKYSTENIINILKLFVIEMRTKSKNGNTTISEYGQQSASEGFIQLIDCLETKNTKILDSIFGLFNIRYQFSIECDNCNDIVSINRDNSCHLEMFGNLNLDTEEKFSDYIYTHHSLLENYRCEKCNQVMKEVNQAEKLRMVRDVIVILFNKYYVKKNIWYPQTLTFQNNSGGAFKYRLISTIEHSGGLNGGHYWARCARKSPSNDSFDYYSFNDETVNRIKELTPTINTYMLFYHLYSSAPS